MDIATIVGLLGAFGLIFASIDDIGAFIDTPSILIVVCGSAMVTLARSSLSGFLGAGAVAGKCFMYKMDAPKDLIETMVELATIARKDGMIALEGQELSNKFLAKGVGMLVDGSDADVIKPTLERVKDSAKIRQTDVSNLFAAWGEVAPAMGMIGTLIGLVQMLGNMSDPKAIGPAMAVALLTTMYGAILANVIMLPLNMKLVEMCAAEEQNNELIIEGLLFMAEGGNPRVLGDKLAAFLDPKVQAELATG